MILNGFSPDAPYPKGAFSLALHRAQVPMILHITGYGTPLLMPLRVPGILWLNGAPFL